MQFKGNSKIIYTLAFSLIMQMFFSSPVSASNVYTELDDIRAELNHIKDKTSKTYIKNKQRLQKLIVQNKIDYSTQARFNDVERLISQQRYNGAIYELKDMLDNNIEPSLCNEFLGDISKKNSQTKDAAQYYKTALKADKDNVSARYKLAKLYFENNKNTMGIENLKLLVDSAQERNDLLQIEEYVKNHIKPNNNLEANNLYEILGNIYIKTNRKEEAYRAFSRAIQLYPGDIYLKYYLGDLFYENNRPQDAIVLYNSILKENPKDGQIRNAKAKSLAKEGQLLSANKEYLTVLEQYPTSNQAKYGIYKIYENKLTPDKILEKINSNVPTYTATKEDILSFAKILEAMEDYNAAQNFRTFALRMDYESQMNKKALTEQQTKVQQPAQQPQRVQPAQQIQNKTTQQVQKPAPEQKKEVQQAQPVQKQVQQQVQKTQPQQQPKTQPQQQTQKTQQQVQKQVQQRVQDEQKQLTPQIKKEEVKKEEEVKKQPQQQTQQTQKQPAQQRVNKKQSTQKQPVQKKQAITQNTKATPEPQKQPQKQDLPKETTGVKPENKPEPQQKEISKAQAQADIETLKKQEYELKEQQLLNLAQKEKAQMLEEQEKQEKIESKLIEKEREKAKAKNPKKYEEYKQIIDKYNATEPKTAEIYIAIANTYKLTGELTNALKNYKEALKLNPVDSDINYNLALAYLELNSPVSARYYLNKAINLDKNNTKAYNLLAFVNQKITTKTVNEAFGEYENKNYMKALTILEDGIKSYPHNAQLYYYRALVYNAMNRNAAQIMDLQKSIELNPAYYMAYYQLGLAYEKINDERNALVAYERFLSIEPDEKDLVNEVQRKVVALEAKYY